MNGSASVRVVSSAFVLSLLVMSLGTALAGPGPPAFPIEHAGPSQGPAAAGDLQWVRTGGPPGGLGYDIRYRPDEPNTWYVTDNFAGVHISTDNGRT